MYFFGKENLIRRLRKLAAYFLLSPSEQQVHRKNLFFSFAFLAVMISLFYFVGILKPSAPPISPEELDLSGEWKILYEDKGAYSQPDLDDSQWCLTGVPDPAFLTKYKAPKNCPKASYAPEKMRGKTYWYRKQVAIPVGSHWKDPSLFLGAIKHKAWIYWDGNLIAISNAKDGLGMVAVQLDTEQVKAGNHILAIRVSSLDSRYPGIFHAYSRKVTLGEATNNVGQLKKIVNERYIFPSLNLFVQLSGLLLVIFLLLLGKGNGDDFFWLSVYFFGTSIGNLYAFSEREQVSAFLRAGIIFTSFGVAGFGLKYCDWMPVKSHTRSRILLSLLMMTTLFYGVLAVQDRSFGDVARRLSMAVAIFPLLFFLISTSFGIWKLSMGSKIEIHLPALFSFTLVGALHTLNVVNEFFLFSSPIITGHPAFKSALSVALVAAMIYQYTQQERALAFFGRFIRPGLKKLLKEKIAKGEYSDVKIFRPRQIAIMKIDIVGHTETTFQMPYGMKRLFQDIWFTLIDHVVAERVFMDKNVGDGSIYCFSEFHQQGSCASALQAALEIRDEAVLHFDQEYKHRLQELIELNPELEEPAEAFFAGYKARTGKDFWQRHTQVRIGLVYGYVDEGLWGLTSQSHYDVQGDLVSMAARVEAKAKENEILMDTAFLRQLEGTLSPEKVIPRQETLKGIGEVTLYALKCESELKLVA